MKVWKKLTLLSTLCFFGLFYLLRLTSPHEDISHMPLDGVNLTVNVHEHLLRNTSRLRKPVKAIWYCNNPSDITNGSEGQSTKELILISAHILIRHGNRLPLGDLKELGPLNLETASCQFNITMSMFPQLLKQFTVRMNEVGYIKNWSFSMYPSRECSLGDLSQIGVEQLIRSGMVLQQAYRSLINTAGIQVTSTHIPRTFQSALAFIYGLVPDFDFSQISIEKRFSFTLCKTEFCSCAKLKSLLSNSQRSLNLLRKSDSSYKRLIKLMKENLSRTYKIKPFYPWKSAHDLLMYKICREEPLPCQGKVCLSEKYADMNWRSLNYYHEHMSTEPDTVRFSQLSMYPFLKEVTDRLAMHSRPPVEYLMPKVIVYAAHDNTLTHLLIALGYVIDHWPPFASRLSLELYRSVSSKLHYVKVVYNGYDITHKLTFCRGVTPNELCPASKLLLFVNQLITAHDYKSYADACAI